MKNVFPESPAVNVFAAAIVSVSMWFLESTKLWYCLEVFCFKAVVFWIEIVKIIFVCYKIFFEFVYSMINIIGN